MSARSWLVFASVVGCAVGCGSRSSPSLPTPPVDGGVPSESCNGRDDDRDGVVDEPFRNDAGLYLDPQHCGACNTPCTVDETRELATSCQLVDGAARCTATACQPGFAPASGGHCASLSERFCLACTGENDCGTLLGARCATIAGESRCTTTCEAGCPSGARCDGLLGVCVPSSGSCSCGEGDSFAAACRPPESELADGGVCVGVAQCANGQFSACATSAELCDEQDNDCDGETDEDFRDQNGAYSVSLSHCGRCGVVCEASPVPGYAITCAGDPFAPSCVLACPDAVDGVDVGDLLDANRAFGDGCECRVSALIDAPGPQGLAGAALDSNCDGADGDVLSSYYVAVDGDDSGPGSPTRPLATIAEALSRAVAVPSSGQRARRSVFVAGGTYVGTVTLPDGVTLYGGYRRDFLDLDPAAHPTELLATAAPRAELGAALLSDGAGTSPTELAFVTLRGADANAPGQAAVAALLRGTGPSLSLRGVTLVAGVPGQGTSGGDGAAGLGPSAEAGAGGLPRVALEDARGTCLATPANTVAGGSGGVAQCGGTVLQGGSGGAPGCPSGSGSSGGGGAGSGGAPGGRGGDEATGPIQAGTLSCPGPRACCGLADFSVSSDYTGPSPGSNGAPGGTGSAGAGCADGLGSFGGGTFVAQVGGFGQAGAAGGAGGGGGGGGGATMFFPPGDASCQWPDGLGGGGGGGGAGGCGGAAGQGGTSGAPSVALLLLRPRAAPSLLGLTLITADGGRGGAGGSGGDGGQGGQGGAGGSLPLAQRIIPPLAGASPGAPGGSGGAGGAGGSGGGGCGGASAGVWAVGLPGAGALAAGNRFQLGRGGAGGEGGPGAVPGRAGRTGEVRDVVVE